jgi:hypothetical protein
MGHGLLDISQVGSVIASFNMPLPLAMQSDTIKS